MKDRLTIFSLWLMLVTSASAVQSSWVHYDDTHTLVYSNDDLGNHIPDFSFAGFGEGGVMLPTNEIVRQTLDATAGDNTANLQNAINFVSNLSPDVNGFRGVVLLNPGVYEVDGTLTISKGGVILRGSGSSPAGTVLHFLGSARQTVALQGSASVSQLGSSYNITNIYVPLGATNFNLTDASTLSVGNLIIVRRPVTQIWIDAIGENVTNVDWSPSSGLGFERTITAINGNQITIDIPLFNPIEQEWCTGYVYRVSESSGRITNSAIESLRLRSDFSDASTNWGNGRALNFDDCKNCWFKNLVVDNFYNGINSGDGAKWCTVQDCFFVSNTVPTTSAGAAAFGGSGQMLLWQRCGTSNSTTYHVLVTQAAVPGPNVFLNFNSIDNGYDCGPHQRWAAGVLIDNNVAASINGNNTGIKLENRGTAGSGQGYGAGYSIIYNGDSKGIINEIPQVNHHYNWAIGRGSSAATFIHRSDDGVFDATNGTVNPRSLYLEQLRERLGGLAIENIGYPLFTISASPASQAVLPQSSAIFTVNLGDPTSMSNIVSLAIDSLPANLSAVLNTNIVTGAGAATLTVTASNSIAPGNYTFNVIGANSGLTHTSLVNLVVGSFSLSSSPQSQTILPGGNTSYLVNVATNANFSGIVSLGLSGLPSDANAAFNPSSLNGTVGSSLNVTTTSDTPSGSYVLTIFGTNGNVVVSTTVALNLTTPASSAGVLFWTNGATDINWSNPFNWTNMTAGGFGPPGAQNSLIFTNWSVASGSALTAPGSGILIPANYNSFVNASFTVQSLTNFANAPNSSPNFHNLQIVSGATLAVAGAFQVGGNNSFDFGANNVVNLTISGTGGALQVNGLVNVNSTSASTGLHDALLDMSGLDRFILNGSQLALGVEGGGAVKRASGIVYLARTNSITVTAAGYTDTTGTGSPNSGSPGLYLGHNGSTFGSGSQVYLGITNAIFMDYATIGRGDTNVLLAFNPAFLNENPSAYIRGLSGSASRVGVYVVGDGSAGAQANNAPSTNDFTGGTVDALVNYLCVGRGRSGNNSTVGGSGVLTFNAGSINANTLAVGFTYPSGSNSPATGIVNVNGSATLTVNSNLLLAQAANVSGQTAVPQAALNINGGTVQATNIIGGGGISTINFNSGTMDLQFGNPAPGIIANVSALNIGGLLENAASIVVSNTITIGSGGTLAGNTLVIAPALVVGGALSPGVNGVGAITNSGNLWLGAGGIYECAVQDANGATANGWDFIQTAGQLNVQAAGTNPFVISLESLAGGEPDAVSNFSYDTNYDWGIASAGGGLTNFTAAKFAVDTTFFQNDLAGGYFYIRTNGNLLVLSFTNNHPPVALADVIYRTGGMMAIPVSSLTNFWSDPDGDPVELVGVNSTSTNGSAVSSDGNFIYYTNANNVADAIFYTVQDVRTNPPAVYQPDDTVRTATGEIIILPPPVITGVTASGSSLVFNGAGGAASKPYTVLGSTNLLVPLSDWTRLATNAFDAGGGFRFTNVIGPNVPWYFYTLQIQ